MENQSYKKLNNNSMKKIYEFLDNEYVHYDTIPLYKISSGILVEDTQEGITLYGIYKTNKDILSEYDEKANVLYSNLDLKKISLILPEVYEDSQGNFYSNKCQIHEYIVEKLDNALIEDILINNHSEMMTFFANQKTFENITEIMYKEKNALESINFEELIIYIDDISKISYVKSALEDKGYFISYAFSKFKTLPSFIIKSSVLYIVILISLTIFCIACFFISYKNYINVQKRDIGILKHFGYSNDKITSIYLWPLRINIIFIAGATFIFNFIQYKNRIIFFAATFLMIVLACIIYIIIKLCIIKKYANTDILYLIKYNKDFE